MELSSFSENIVTETFERNGETVELKINIDAVVPDYYEHLADLLAPLNKRFEDLLKRYKQLEKSTKQKRTSKEVITVPSLLPVEKELAELERESYAIKLTCPVKLPDGSTTQLLKGWSLVDNGSPIAPTKENLMRLPPKAVKELWERCIARTEVVKKRVDEETEETSDNMLNGSRALHVVGQST